MKFIEFTADEVQPTWAQHCTTGKATIEVLGKTRTVTASRWPAHATSAEHITIHGLAVRYETGAKVWAGSIEYWPGSGHFNNLSGGLDNRVRAKRLSLVGFYEDAAEQHRSQR